MQRTKIRAVVFDAVGTLITPEPAAGIVYHAAGARHGSACGEGDVVRRFAEAFRRAVRPSSNEANRTDEGSERAFWREVVGAVFNDLDGDSIEACFTELFDHFARPESWRVYSDAPPALRELRRVGLTVAVASNFDSRLHAVFEGHQELAVIERRFVSSELGWRKPDRRFFEGVCRELGRELREVVYVGDERETDVVAAKAAGLAAWLVDRDASQGSGVLTDLRQLPRRIDPT